MSLKDALAGVRLAQAEPEQANQGEAADKSKPSPTRKANSQQGRLMTGKSSNPAFEKVGVYLRTETRRKAERKWEDQSGGDLSDLIENLLKKYAGD